MLMLMMALFNERHDLLNILCKIFIKEPHIILDFFNRECLGDSTNSLPHLKREARLLECSYVHEVYEEIAGHFSGTRHTQWPLVAKFLAQQPQNSLVLDVGCGNGKYLTGNDHLIKVAVL